MHTRNFLLYNVGGEVPTVEFKEWDETEPDSDINTLGTLIRVLLTSTEPTSYGDPATDVIEMDRADVIALRDWLDVQLAQD